MVSKSGLIRLSPVKQPSSPFAPFYDLNKASDTLTICFDAYGDYSERIGDQLTLYRSLKTNAVVGCRIKGISLLLDDLPNYVQINQGCVDLSIVLLAIRGSAANKAERETINSLARAASERNLAFEMDCVVS